MWEQLLDRRRLFLGFLKPIESALVGHPAKRPYPCQKDRKFNVNITCLCLNAITWLPDWITVYRDVEVFCDPREYTKISNDPAGPPAGPPAVTDADICTQFFNEGSKMTIGRAYDMLWIKFSNYLKEQTLGTQIILTLMPLVDEDRDNRLNLSECEQLIKHIKLMGPQPTSK
ncbi:hypothetical protein C0J45_3557 [Silurus meridionalis]|nr:hypothetical protein C0J45_3557 [Silurus meridionalis]